jgi:integrase
MVPTAPEGNTMKQGRRTRARDSRGRPVPGIYQRDGRYIAGFESEGKWKMQTLEAATLTEARRERESLLAGLREGRTAAPAAITTQDLFEDWLRSRTVGDRTAAHERWLVGAYLKAISAKRAQSVTASDLGSVLSDLRERGFSPWTRVAVHRILRGTFAHGVRRGVLTRSPADGLGPQERPKQRNARKVEVLDSDQLARLVAAASTERWKVALGLAGYAGLRLGEIRGLRWSAIDLDGGAIHVTTSMSVDGTPQATKTEAGNRTVPLVPALRRLLVQWQLRSPRSRPNDLVVCTAEGRPVQERNVRRALDEAKEAAGLDTTAGRLSAHSLRHSFASVLATSGLAPTTLSRIVGHSDAGFTLKTYARDARSNEAVAEAVLASAAEAGL